MKAMIAIAVALRGMQFFAHEAHQKANGPTFQQDHDFLGALYAEYEDDYDAVVERMLWPDNDAEVKPCRFTLGGAQMADELGEELGEVWDRGMVFGQLTECEVQLRRSIDEAVKTATEGTRNLLAGLADKSEQRWGKIGRFMIRDGGMPA